MASDLEGPLQLFETFLNIVPWKM